MSRREEIGVARALTTILTVLQLLDEQWDTIDDHTRRVTVRLAIETARDQRSLGEGTARRPD